MDWDKGLERTVNGVILILALAMVPRVVSNVSHDFRATSGVAKVSARFSPDFKGLSLSHLIPNGSHAGMVLFISPDCPFCEASLPFYRQLASEVQASGLTLFVAVTGRGTPPEKQAYLRKNRLAGAIAMNPRPLVNLGLRATPTLLVYNKSGVVLDGWVGRLNISQEDIVQSALSKLAQQR